ncbi:MAG: hypothetical protein GQ534_10270, partial [Candidatus Delongbacteria bacterium]|nr:hypothetical protein [Candidatus Delongbacteria bacterium]
MKNDKLLSKLINDLNERAKESKCLYEIQNLLNDPKNSFDDVCYNMVTILPMGWQFPEICKAQLIFKNKMYQVEEFEETAWYQESPIIINGKTIGQINVFYTEERPLADIGPFLKEEVDLIQTIGKQFELYALHQQLKIIFDNTANLKKSPENEWRLILDLLRRTDPNLAVRISRKMINFLCLSGVKEAESLLENFNVPENMDNEHNCPYQLADDIDSMTLICEVFKVAEDNLNENEILSNIYKWIKQESSVFMSSILNNDASGMDELISALEKYHFLSEQGLELSQLREKSFRVALIRRFMSDQGDFIDIAKQHLKVSSFYD